MDDVIHIDTGGEEVRNRGLIAVGEPYSSDQVARLLPPIKPRILRCSNGHTTAGEYVQTIGDHSYCTRCMAAMLDAFGARVREGTGEQE